MGKERGIITAQRGPRSYDNETHKVLEEKEATMGKMMEPK